MSEVQSINEFINIDTKEFFNPFDRLDCSSIQRRILYSNYFKNKSNEKYLEFIGNKIVISNEKSLDWTRAEVLQSLACKYGIRNSLTEINKDILDVDYGIIVHEVNCQGTMDDEINKKIKDKYPIVYENYLKVKVMNPGTIQMVKVNNDKKSKYSLFVCNLFGGSSENPFKGIYSKIFNVRSALKKLMKIRKTKPMENLPIYFPFHMGKESINWDRYVKYISKYHPDAVICKL